MPGFPYSQRIGYEGQVASGTWVTEISGNLEGLYNETSSRLPWGRVVVAGSSEGGVKLPSATGQRVLGVLVADQYEKDHLTNETGLPAGKPASVIKKGHIFMVAETDLTAGTTLFFRHTANGTPGANEALGRIRGNADTAKADAATFLELVKSVKAGEIAIVRVKL